jgi:hypothetical protein
MGSKFDDIKPGWQFEYAGDQMFFVFHGKRIAERVRGQWASLEAGYTVTDDGTSIEVGFNGAPVQ